MASPPRRMTRLSTKLLALMMLVSLTPLAVIAYFSVTTPVALFQSSTQDRLAAVAKAKASAIDQFMDDRRRDVERIATLISKPLEEVQRADEALSARGDVVETEPELPELKDAEALHDKKSPRTSEPAPEEATAEHEQDPAPDPLQQTVTEKRTALKAALNLILWDQAQFEELLVLDSEGRVVVGTFEDHEKHSAAELEYFQQGRKTTHVQAVFWSPITEQLTAMVATPIRLEADQIGVLAARLNLKEFFRLINDSTGLGSSGETLVGKRVGNAVQFMAPTRHDGDAALRRSVPVVAQSPIVEAAAGHPGEGLRTDYRGKRVLAAWRHVPTLDWGLVTKLDYEEAMAGVTEFRTRALLLSAFVIVLVVIVSTVTGRALVKPLNRLRFAADQVSRGDLDVDLDIRSTDEIGDLADSFERMVAAIKFFREHSRKAEEDEDPVTPPGPSA